MSEEALLLPFSSAASETALGFLLVLRSALDRLYSRKPKDRESLDES